MFSSSYRKRFVSALFLVSFLIGNAVRAAQDVTLKPGDPAPALSVSKWVKGEEVKSFDKDKVYVVECWATWCGPCKATIPHVSELNTKYKDQGVVFIGMDVWERDTAGVEPFVKEMGDKMNYRVAMDEKNGMATNWLAAAGQNGIPCAFIVDKQSKIAWIGHPARMEPILKQVVAGTFDPKKQAEIDAKMVALENDFGKAYKAGDADKMLSLADDLLKIDPDAGAQVGQMKMNILLSQKKDYKAAYALALSLAGNELKTNSEALNQIAWTILDEEGIEKRDFDVALKLALQADGLTEHKNAAILDTLARAYFEKGQKDKAIEIETLAISKAEDPEMKTELGKTLEKYKAGK